MNKALRKLDYSNLSNARTALGGRSMSLFWLTTNTTRITSEILTNFTINHDEESEYLIPSDGTYGSTDAFGQGIDKYGKK
tara:strand:- start:358 stop:597 length:240 start_codon:yes stop_codon:yes gene_type:complete